jgi:hypothetical protein
VLLLLHGIAELTLVEHLWPEVETPTRLQAQEQTALSMP